VYITIRKSDELVEVTFKKGMALLSSALNLEVTNAPSAYMMKLKVLWQTLQRIGWTNEEFEKRVRECVLTFRYPTWTVGEFIGGNTTGNTYELMPYNQALKRFGNTNGLDGYMFNGKPFYREHDGYFITTLKPCLWDGKAVNQDFVPEGAMPL
jgi:hypothetical protein